MIRLHNRLYFLFNKHRTYVLILIDTLISIFSYLSTFIISGIQPVKIDIFLNTWYIYTIIYILTFILNGVYKNIWRYAGVQDIYKCLKSSIIANLIFLIITKAFSIDLRYYVYLVVFVETSFITMAARVIYRAMIIIVESRRYSQSKNYTNILMVGAGQATMAMLSEIKRNNYNNYNVCCIVDDDKTKIGRRINSVPVAGPTTIIPELAIKYKAEEIIISIPSLDKINKKRILDICSTTKCKLKILPDVYSLLNQDKNIMNNLRDVQIEDLLGREPIRLDCSVSKSYIHNKTVLVTGGGGSIGSELCRQIASCSPSKLIILDIYENNAYDIQQELIRKHGDSLCLEVEIASVRDFDKLDKFFAHKNIDVVFHAAAHKHVPLMEHNPEEAVKNNILGTYNVAYMSNKYKVQKFVLISTDKAVNPTNIMGATKRVCEMIIQAFAKTSNTNYSAVRFGNVLGSNGSVIPLFKEQIKSGGPVTITHEEIIRYFMTIPEAVQLVLQSAYLAKGGEIFVLDMGEPVKIKDLAYNLIRLSGLEPEKDIEIKYTGLRPGEKLFEELLIKSDNNHEITSMDKIFIEKPVAFDSINLFSTIKKLKSAANDNNKQAIVTLLESLVPTYKTDIKVEEIQQIQIVESIDIDTKSKENGNSQKNTVSEVALGRVSGDIA